MVIALKNVSFAYPGKSPVLASVDAGILPGTMVVVTGPSGGGKSTLLRLLTGLEVPSSGHLEYHGQPYADQPPFQLRSRVMYVAQKPVMVRGSVRDNLLMGFRFAVNSGRETPPDSRLERMLGRALLNVGLDQEADDLSVGQKQRLSILRGIIMSPDVLVLDEPTSALDVKSKEAVEQELVRLNTEKGMTMVMVTHREFEASGNAVPWHVENGHLTQERI